MTTCEEAKQMRSGINVQAKVVDKGEVRTVNTKFGETKVCDAYLEDESVESNLHFGLMIQKK